MAKAQTAAARFVTEVVLPPEVPVMRRGKVPTSLDTIAEDDREYASDHQGFAATWSRRALARERAGGFVSELSIRCFSDARGQQPAPAAAGRVAITS